MVSYSVKPDDKEVSFNYHTSIDFLVELRALMQQATMLVGFNLKFDLHWASRYGIKSPDRIRIWDCQVAEFIITGQKQRYPSLDGCCEKYGLGSKDDKIKEYWDLGIDTEFIPEDELRHYNNLDVELTYKLYLIQRELMTPEQRRLCIVMGLDLLCLQEMEENGVKFDVELCKIKETETTEKLKEVTEELLRYSPTPDINLGSGQHLSCLLYGGKFDIDYVTTESTIYKSGPRKGTEYLRNVHNVIIYECPQLLVPLPKSETKLKKKLPLPDGTIEEITIYTTDEDTLKRLKTKTKEQRRLIELLLLRAEYAKLVETYYAALPELLEKMQWGEYLHGQYNAVVAATGRLSSSAPNMQNFSGDVDQLIVSRYE